MKITLDVVRAAAKRAPDVSNAKSFLTAIERFGGRFGLDQPHRLAQFVAQAMHESGEFRYDREIWGPTAQQLKYDPASGSELSLKLGNTKLGDGKRYAGRTGFQLTGRANYRAFTAWVRKHIDKAAPDFEAQPELVNTDPWEGLVPLWYWTSRNLNRYADQGDAEMITKRINGGLNGYADRLAYLARLSLVLLGFGPGEIRKFQIARGLEVDGDAGPRTRAELHRELVNLTAAPARASDVAAAPVVDEKPVAITPPALDKPVSQTAGFWERVAQLVGLAGIGGASWLGDWRVILAIAGGLVVITGLGLVLHGRIIAAVRALKQELAA